MAHDAMDKCPLAKPPLKHPVERGLRIGPNLLVLNQRLDVLRDLQRDLIRG